MSDYNREENIEHLKILNKEMLGFSKEIRTQNFTRKTQGKNYPIKTGSSTQVRRPFRDLLRWMDKVEEQLYLIVDLMEESSK